MTNPNANIIAIQNDAFRLSIAPFLSAETEPEPPLGRVILTRRVRALGTARVIALLLVVRNYSSFDLENDPYGERDFGAIDLHGAKWLWKIDYYANGNCDSGSEDPADPAKCYRILTIMHSDEYWAPAPSAPTGGVAHKQKTEDQMTDEGRKPDLHRLLERYRHRD